MCGRRRRTLASILAMFTLAACARATPPDPVIDFDAASTLPASADYASVLAQGGRVLDRERTRVLVGAMGDQAFLAAIEAPASGDLVVRPDGRVCLEDQPPSACRILVADGKTIRLFDPEGRPVGTLLPSAG